MRHHVTHIYACTRFIIKVNRIMALALASWFVTLSQQKQYNYHMGRLKLRSLILADLPMSSMTMPGYFDYLTVR